MRHYILTKDQQAATGKTDLWYLSYAEAELLAESTDNTAATVVLEGLVLGDVVEQDFHVDIKTAWAGAAALTATVSVGVVGDATAITPALTITTDGTGTAAGNGNSSANQTDPAYRATTGINLIATFTPDADSAVDGFTAGELLIWGSIRRWADRSVIAA